MSAAAGATLLEIHYVMILRVDVGRGNESFFVRDNLGGLEIRSFVLLNSLNLSAFDFEGLRMAAEISAILILDELCFQNVETFPPCV